MESKDGLKPPLTSSHGEKDHGVTVDQSTKIFLNKVRVMLNSMQ